MFGKKKEEGMLDPAQQVKNWYSDRYQAMVIQRNFLMLITLISLVGVVVSAFAVQVVTSAKTIEPFVIEVSQKSGVATVVDQLSTKQFVADEVISRYFIAQYIRAREGYDYHQFQYNYNTITRLFSSSDVYKEFRSTISSTNEQSPTALLGNSGRRDVSITSIIFMQGGGENGEKTAQVRFQYTDTGVGGRIRDVKHKVALVVFSFKQLKLSIEDRYVNPLGFTVTSYKADDEVL
jgi:type IV secretion system protein VirB8